MKTHTHLAFTSLVITLLLGGCATDNLKRYNKAIIDTSKSANAEPIVKKWKEKNAPEEKTIKLNIHDKWVYLVMKSVSKKFGVPIDKRFIPSKEYTISAKKDVSFMELLELVQRQTGVEYKLEDGILSVKNKDVIEPYEKAIRCSKGNTFSISLKDAPIEKVFSRLIKNGYSVAYDTRYSNIGNVKQELDPFPNVTFYYKGCSEKEALKKLAKIYDLKITFRGKDVTVKDYDVLEVNVPVSYTSTYNSGTSSIGDSEAKTGLRLKEEENPSKELETLISSYMSPKGRAYLSKRGYVTIIDRPNSIKTVKKMLKKELNAQQNVELDISIISVELNDKFKSGVDWTVLLSSSKFINLGLSSPLSTIENAFTLSGTGRSTEQILQLLGEYGKSKMVKKHKLNTRSGSMSSLKSVDIEPYVTTETIVSNGISQTNREAKSIESGIVLNIKPTLDGSFVNMNVDISVSQYLGDKDVGDGFTLPRQKSNKIQTPITVKLGDTAILTGLKLKSTKMDYAGLPSSQSNNLSFLTGSNEDEVETKEYLIFITPRKPR